MRIVPDPKVFFSGLLFTGPPYKILQAWRDGRVRIVLSPEILEEYQRVGMDLESRFRDVKVSPFLELLTVHAEMIHSPSILPRIQEDPTDNFFLACALAGRANFVVSGDRHLLKVHEFQGIKILRPRKFFEGYLKGR
jgi:uncharacterized protein